MKKKIESNYETKHYYELLLQKNKEFFRYIAINDPNMIKINGI